MCCSIPEGVQNIKPAFKMIWRTTNNQRHELQMSLRVRFANVVDKDSLYFPHRILCYFILLNSVQIDPGLGVEGFKGLFLDKLKG